jgi:Mrp family chromosome partitioning ATPase
MVGHNAIRRRHTDGHLQADGVREERRWLIPSFLEAPIVELYDAVATGLGGCDRKIVQFIGVRGGEGTSTVARQFARVAAAVPDRSVLLLDAATPAAGRGESSAFATVGGVLDAIQTGRSVEDALVRDDASRLALAILTGGTSSANLVGLPAFDDLWRDLRKRFDLVVVDSPPAIGCVDGIAVARKVDGVILLFEAEKTPLAMAKHASEKIIKNGGHLVGVALNRRKYHVPQFLYRLL